MLYSDAGIQTSLTMNQLDVLNFNNQTDGEKFDESREVIRILLPEGLRNEMSIDTKTPVTFCSDGNCLMKYMG